MPPSAASASASAAVRVSCQVIERATGRPVRRSHSTTDSRSFAKRAAMVARFANERESVVLWDRRTGRPVARSITWQDTRTAAEADALAADGGINRLQRTTGLPISTYSSALKLGWLL